MGLGVQDAEGASSPMLIGTLILRRDVIEMSKCEDMAK
jgi:hypothetical protein